MSDSEEDLPVLEFVKKRKAELEKKHGEKSKSTSSIEIKKENANSKNVPAVKKEVATKSSSSSSAKKPEPAKKSIPAKSNSKKKKVESDDEQSDSESEEDSDDSGSSDSDDHSDDSEDDNSDGSDSSDESSSESDESDDDKPVKHLAKKPKVEKSEKKEKSSKSVAKKAASNRASKSLQFYNETDKGKLVQALLVRWWYAIEWPKAEEVGTPPDGFEPLDGFPGVFISTRSDSLGTIFDLRNKETCPSLRNISKWPSSKIKETCILAYEKQMEALAEAGQERTKLFRTLRDELRTIKAISPDKADRDAKNYSFDP